MRGLRTTIRGRLLVEAAAWLVLAAVGAVFVTFGLDYALHLERGLRIALAAAAVAVLLFLLWRHGVRPLSVPMDITAMALLVERRFGALADRLITAVEFSDGPTRQWEGVSQAMIEVVGAEANRMAQPLNFKQVVERRRVRTVALAAAAAVLLLTGLSVAKPETMGLLFRRNVALADIDWPQETYLKVCAYETGNRRFEVVLRWSDPNFVSVQVARGQEKEILEGADPNFPEVSVVRGDDLEIFVEASGKVPRDDDVLLHVDKPSGERLQVGMKPVTGRPGRFAGKIQTVAEPFRFYVTGGDDELDRRRKHQVWVVDPPSLRQVKFRVDHRAYMKRPPTTFEQGSGIIQVTPGSTLWLLDGVANKPLRSGRLLVDDKDREPNLVIYDVAVGSGGREPRGVRGKLDLAPENLASTRTLKVVLTGVDGTVNLRGQQFIVQVQPDLAPSVEVRKRGVGAVLTANAYFPVILQVKDDYGISEANIAVTCKNRPRHDFRVEKELLPAATEFRVESNVVDIQPLGFKPGDLIQVFAEVRDNMPEDLVGPPSERFPNGSPGPNLSASGQIEFRIVKDEELRDLLIQRQKELGFEFKEAITVQESSRGKSLAALEDANAGRTGPATANLLNESSKLQASVGAECAKAAETLIALLEEMKYNRLQSETIPKIMGALTDIQDLSVPIREAVAELMDCARIADASVLGVKLDAAVQKQVDIKDRMNKILAAILEYTTRLEMEKAISGLIEESKRLRDEMEKAARVSLEPLLEKTTMPATQPE